MTQLCCLDCKNVFSGAAPEEGRRKLNCWEFYDCGREPGGPREHERGVYPMTISRDLDGIHGGQNAGRACWVVAGSLCGGKLQGSFAMKLPSCWNCEFMKLVQREEKSDGAGFSITRMGMEWRRDNKLKS